MVKRVGIIGYGNLGKYLVSKIEADDRLELAFVWNRTKAALQGCRNILENLEEVPSTRADIVVEVSHPSVTRDHGSSILKHCDYMIGSPTALADEALLQSLENSSTEYGVYVPSGALWGGEDIRKLSDSGLLKSLTVTMRKHPGSLKLEGHLREINARVTTEEVTIYEGPVRDVCALAPNNTNTMAAAALAGRTLGFDKVIGRLIADPRLTNCHIVEVDVVGHPKPDGSCFRVHTVRTNPAAVGEVTGQATYAAYFQSLLKAGSRGPGIHLC